MVKLYIESYAGIMNVNPQMRRIQELENDDSEWINNSKTRTFEIVNPRTGVSAEFTFKLVRYEGDSIYQRLSTTDFDDEMMYVTELIDVIVTRVGFNTQFLGNVNMHEFNYRGAFMVSKPEILTNRDCAYFINRIHDNDLWQQTGSKGTFTYAFDTRVNNEIITITAFKYVKKDAQRELSFIRELRPCEEDCVTTIYRLN